MDTKLHKEKLTTTKSRLLQVNKEGWSERIPGMLQPLCFRGVGCEGTQRVFVRFPKKNNLPVFVFD
jgi:hypothetical protein